MPAFSRKVQKFVHQGINWNRSVDTIPAGQLCYARNVRSLQAGEIQPRPGLTSFSTLVGAPAYAHSMSRLNNYSTALPFFDYVYVIGADHKLFVGKTTGDLTNGAINPVKLPPTGATASLSGNPLTMVDAATASGASWKYIGDNDSSQMLTVGYYPGDTPGTNMARALTMGMKPPVFAPTINVIYGGYLTGSYQWMCVFRRINTGAQSNPSAPSRNTQAIPATPVVTSYVQFNLPLAPQDPLIGAADTNITVDVYRFGGTVFRWALVGTMQQGPANAVSTFTDNLPDSQILSAPAPSQTTDPVSGLTRFNLFQPFVTQKAAVYSTTNGTVTKTAGGDGTNTIWLLTRGGADTFDTGILQGSVISINNALFTIYQVLNSTQLTITEDGTGPLTAGGGSYPWAIPGGTLVMGRPCPHIWGPYGTGQSGSVIFGCGALNEAGTLFWTNGNDPDSSDIANSLVVTSPSEPLRGGCIYNGTAYCWSTERMFQIFPSLTAPGQYYVQEVVGGKGLWEEWSLTVQTNSIADQSISWVGKDGVYNFTPGGGAQSLTDGPLYPFFPHDNSLPISPGTLYPFLSESSVVFPDFTTTSKALYHRLLWCDGELFYDFPQAGGSTYATLVYDSKQIQGWAGIDLYKNTNTSPISRMTEVAGNNMKVALGGTIYDYGTMVGTLLNDAGTDIQCRVVTPQDDQGDARGSKLYGDLLLDAAAGGSGGLTFTPRTDLGATTLTPITFTPVNRTQSPVDLSGTGLGVLSRTFGLDVTWTSTGAIASLFQYELAWVPKPEITARRATDKTDDGWSGTKRVLGFSIETNTFNQTRLVNVLLDGVQATNPLTSGTIFSITTGANTQLELPFAIAPALATELAIAIDATDSSTAGWEVFSVRWVWEKWPDLAQENSPILYPLNTAKIKYLRGFTLPVDTGGVSLGTGFLALFDAQATSSSQGFGAFTTPSGKKTPVEFTLQPPVAAHTVELQPTAAWRIWPEEIVWDAEEWPELAAEYGPWTDIGTAATKYLRGVTVPAETNGGTVTIQAIGDFGGSPVSLAPTISTTALQKAAFTLLPTSPLIGHQFQLRSLSAARVWWGDCEWDAEVWPSLSTEVSPWFDMGTKGAKYLRGFVMPVDTNGAPVTFNIVTSGGVTIATGPFTTTAGVKTPVSFAFTVPQIGHEFQIRPQANARMWVEEIRWDFDPWPELIAEAGPWQTLGVQGAKYLRGVVMVLDTGGSPVSYTLLSSDGGSVVIGPLTTTAREKTAVAWAFTTPLIGHQFELIPNAPVRTWYDEIRWDFDPWPEIIAEASPWMSFGGVGAKYVRGAVIPVDTGGFAASLTLLSSDGGSVGLGPFTTTPSEKTSVSWPFSIPLIGHQFQLVPSNPVRVWYDEIRWDMDQWPELITEATGWLNCGTPKAKFLQGAVIPVETGGVAPVLTLLYETGSVTLTPLVTPAAAVKTPVPYSLATPVAVHEVQIVPSEPCRIWTDEIQWVYEPIPELASTWTGQENTFDLPGYSSLRDCWIAFIGGGNDHPVLTITTPAGSVTYSLPAANGVYLRTYLVLQGQKAPWHKFSVTSTSGIRLIKTDCTVRAKAWGDTGPYRDFQPFGDDTGRGARI